ncbi:uncharacterized protein EAF02_005316 [Botrytis sinoallii]|uniref:uncharacterized protein n=1 Tax=Botrytis sinoallii TaxID=1463999 RepID=UPI0018FF2A13|nr:uncharacterized protein EAF02_005316 [Botrytis sinoallii]KAF7883396.1 hypothetical protein EAF02_005316 [Botrytis sinoallii]
MNIPSPGEGYESAMIQEQSTAVYNRDLFPSNEVENISYNGMPHSSDVYDHPFSSDRCELGNEREGPSSTCVQYTNEDDFTIEPQDTRSSQRTSSSIPWNPPRSSSPCKARNSHSKFLNDPWSEVLPFQQTPITSRQTTELKETAPQHDQIMMQDQTFGKVKDCPTQGDQNKTDPNQLWMNEDEDTLLEKTTSTGFELEEREPSPTFSTFVHNSIESESPLQPRYVAQTSSRINWQDLQQRNSKVYRNEFGQSPNYSTLAYQSSVNHEPIGAAARNKSTPYPYEEKRHIAKRDLSTDNLTSEVNLKNSGIPNTKLYASAEEISKKQISSGNGTMFPEEIEDD